MVNNKKKYLYIFVFILSLLANSFAFAAGSIAIPANYARKLLNIQQWDAMYEAERQKDINYLLGNINDTSLRNLTAQQKDQVIIMMRTLAINQLNKDKDYFKGEVIEQYSKAFTIDELTKLIEYFQTNVMQMMIQSKLDHKEIKIDDLNIALTSQTGADQNIIQWFSGSYLNTRYARFQEDLTAKINKMIYERTKQTLGAIFKEIPVLVKNVS